MDYVWIRLDQKGPDNNLCAKRVCLGKSVTLHLVEAVTLHFKNPAHEGNFPVESLLSTVFGQVQHFSTSSTTK